MQSPAGGSIQSPRPQGRAAAQPQVPFDKELMASLHVLLTQLSEVERQGLVMFHKIEESFKHPYTQQEANNTQMLSPTPLNLISTPAATNALASSSTTTAAPGISASTTPAITSLPTSDTIMPSATTPIAPIGLGLDAATTAAAASTSTMSGMTPMDPLSASTPMNPATPATPSSSLSLGGSNAALTQMTEARQKDVNALDSEKRKLKRNLDTAARMSRP
ncbi:hypothetical protein BGX34_008920 [Mortierella sp. NVP85]|nr:hypothetical protein BGX34_008920 [Mortierella sp. NVP85]